MDPQIEKRLPDESAPEGGKGDGFPKVPMPEAPVLLWYEGRPYTETAYRNWVRTVHEAVRAWDLRMGWIARQIGRTPSHVSNVLGARHEGRRLVPGAETLSRIEALLRRVEAGEVAPQ